MKNKAHEPSWWGYDPRLVRDTSHGLFDLSETFTSGGIMSGSAQLTPSHVGAHSHKYAHTPMPDTGEVESTQDPPFTQGLPPHSLKSASQLWPAQPHGHSQR